MGDIVERRYYPCKCRKVFWKLCLYQDGLWRFHGEDASVGDAGPEFPFTARCTFGDEMVFEEQTSYTTNIRGYFEMRDVELAQER